MLLSATTAAAEAVTEAVTEEITAATEAVTEAATAATEASLDVDSVKELLDSFDPAALLPDLSTLVGKAELVCRVAVLVGPIVLLVMGLAYLLLSPREANYYFGYRCFFGMGSVKAWRFSQRLAGIVFGVLGLTLTLVMFSISGGFAELAVMDMVWKAVRCLLWEIGLTVAAILTINLVCMFRFDAKGGRRGSKKPARKPAG